MRKLFFIILSVLIFNLAHAEALDKIVAIVNDSVITQSQLDSVMQQMRMQIERSQVQPPPASTLRTEALNQLINQSLELQLAKKSNIDISTAELNQAISTIAQQNHISVAELEEKVTADSGLPLSSFKTQIKQQLMISKLQQMAVGPMVKLPEAQVNQAVQAARNQQQDQAEYDISDVLIPLGENPDAAQIKEANTRANEIIKQLKTGKNASELMTTSAEASPPEKTEESSFLKRLMNGFKSTPVQENDATEEASTPDEISTQEFGWRKKENLPEIFAAQLSGLKTGAVIGPIHTANGLHILRINGIKMPATQAVDVNQIRNQLYQQAMMKELPKWLATIRENAYIKIEE